MAPVIIQAPREIQSIAKKSQRIKENVLKILFWLKDYELQAGRNDSNSGGLLFEFWPRNFGRSFIDSFIHGL